VYRAILAVSANAIFLIVTEPQRPIIEWSRTMLPFLSLHALAAQRGDGLRSELLALFERYARTETGLSVAIEPDETKVPCKIASVVPNASANKDSPDEPLKNDSCSRESGH
jgi:hypothetical protein